MATYESTGESTGESTDETIVETINESSKESKDQYTCTICMKEDLNKDEIYYTNCNHEFCKPCLDDWFKRGNQSCPLCRSKINYYKHNDEKYKLIIHRIESDRVESDRHEGQQNQIELNDLVTHNLVVRNIVKSNIRLRFYGISMTSLFLYMLNNYLYELNNVNDLNNELKICNMNNTHLQDSLNSCESNDNYESGYYVSMFNGELSRRCFYPLNFYNICFK